MILKTFILKNFKYLIRRYFTLRRKFFFFKNEILKMKIFKNNSIKFFKKIIKINFSFSIFD